MSGVALVRGKSDGEIPTVNVKGLPTYWFVPVHTLITRDEWTLRRQPEIFTLHCYVIMLNVA